MVATQMQHMITKPDIISTRYRSDCPRNTVKTITSPALPLAAITTSIRPLKLGMTSESFFSNSRSATKRVNPSWTKPVNMSDAAIR